MKSDLNLCLLTPSMLNKNFSRQHIEIFFLFSNKKALTFARKVKASFPEKIRKNISLSSAEFAQSGKGNKWSFFLSGIYCTSRNSTESDSVRQQ